jgi:AraC-like DNA-binding protein
MATVGVSLVRALVEEVCRRGHDGRALLVAAGISPTIVEDPEARIEGGPYDLLQELALSTTGDPALGLHMGENASVSAFNLAGQIASQSVTIRDALDALLTYYRLVADTSAPRLVEDGDLAHIVFEIVRSPNPLCNRLRQEFGVTRTEAIGLAFFRGRPLRRDLEVWFEHARPPYAAEYTRIFGGRERFDRPHAGFVIPRGFLDELLDARQVHHDVRLSRLLKSQADDWLARLDANEGFAGKIRRMIVQSFPDLPPPQLDGAAQRLGISGRVLKRRLQQEGQSFKLVVGAAMHELACAMLAKPHVTVKETAHRLGFSEPSAFQRAFKRWTGVTPKEWRRSRS